MFWSNIFSNIITKVNQSAQKTLSWFSQWLSFYSTQFYFWFSSRNKSKTWPCWTIPTSFSYGAFRSGRRKIRNFSDKYGLFSPRIKNLYASRWGIETSFRDLKYSIGLVNFHAKKKEGILQEIFARFTNFNFCRWVTSQVAIDNSHKKDIKCVSQMRLMPAVCFLTVPFLLSSWKTTSRNSYLLFDRIENIQER